MTVKRNSSAQIGKTGDQGPRSGEGLTAEEVVAQPTIESEPKDAINVGAGGKLEVPREDLDVDLDDGAEIDLINLQSKKIRKPGRREWIILNRASEWVTRMLLHKERPDAIETEYYYVDKSLRDRIHDELKEVRFFPYYSLNAKTFALLPVHVTADNSWYECIAQLFKQPVEFFSQNAIRIMSDKANSRYRVKYKSADNKIVWPTKTTGELLGEAIGADKFIRSADHPIYRDLVDGLELDI